MMACSVGVQATNLWALRRNIQWKESLVLVLGGLAGADADPARSVERRPVRPRLEPAGAAGGIGARHPGVSQRQRNDLLPPHPDRPLDLGRAAIAVTVPITPRRRGEIRST